MLMCAALLVSPDIDDKALYWFVMVTAAGVLWADSLHVYCSF